MDPKRLDQKTVVQIVWILTVRISQAQTPSGSIQGGVPLSRVNANPDDFDDDDDDDDDDDTELMRNSAGNISREQTLAAVMKTESIRCQSLF